MSQQVQHYIPVREDWLRSRTEEILEPAQPICDPHHHLWNRPGWRYLLDEMLADINQGHDIRATVLVQARAMHRADGPEALRPVGETQFAAGIAAMTESGVYGRVRVCAGIIGFADMMLGDAVRPVLEAHLAAGNGRFRGIRHIATWDPDPAMLNPAYTPPEGMMESPAFRAGIATLGAMGLSYDAWIYFHQIPRLTAVARAHPEVPIILDHVGGVLGIGRYAGKRDEVFSAWSVSMREFAACPNAHVKLGGLGMRLPGFGFEERAQPPGSRELAEAWRPYMEHCIALFGTRRCMFESNFPVDKGGYAYPVGWNAFKRLAAGASAEEKDDLFWRTAARVYRLDESLFR
ncbi:MAG TPA: amidohydrolase family protein [Acetobacteraceae bacterium]|nr:amidohydrolase family protein [Acetobacteraceae bacterium]